MNPLYPVLSPAELAGKACSAARENKRFAGYIKSLRPADVDLLFNRISGRVSAGIDCRQCASCCRELEAGIADGESRKLAGILGSPLDHFLEAHTVLEPVTGTCYLKERPCVFLEDNMCKIYDSRPESCADYPGLHREGIRFRMHTVMENYSICPIVYHSVEEAKKLLLHSGSSG